MTEQERALVAKDQWKTLENLASKFAEDAPVENQLMWEDARKAFLLDYVEAVFSCAPVTGRLLPAYSVVFDFVPDGPGSEHVDRVELLDKTWTLEPKATRGEFVWSVYPLDETLTPEELIERVATNLSQLYKDRESAR